MKKSQIPWELKQLCRSAPGCRSFLEIGSRYGETLYEFGRQMPESSRIVSVELPDGPWGRSDSLETLYEVVDSLRIEFGHDTHLILGDSTDSEIIKQVSDLGPYDFVFIDGDHRYEGVKSDWENYGPMGKSVAFHDIVGEMKINGTGERMEVPKLWTELTREHERFSEFVAHNSPMGIGVIYQDRD